MRIFKEVQKFRQWWLYAILLFSLMVMSLPFFINQNSISSISRIINEVLVVIFFLIGIIVFIVSIRLDTKIDEQGIYYRFFPIQLKEKFIPWNEVSGCYVRKYKPLTEYGGWGYKKGFGSGHGKALSIKGSIGIQLKLKNQKKILIGTQKEDEAKRVLITYADKIIKHEN